MHRDRSVERIKDKCSARNWRDALDEGHARPLSESHQACTQWTASRAVDSRVAGSDDGNVDPLLIGIENLMMGANASIELEQPCVATWLADELRKLTEGHDQRIRGTVDIDGDDESQRVVLRRSADDSCVLQVTGGQWQLSASASVDSPGKLAVFLVDWLS